MNGDSPSVQPQRGGDLEHLLAHPTQTPALSGLPLQQAAQAMQDLVGVETEQQAHLVARHHVLNGGGATIGRREVHVERRLHLAHVRFGAAPLAIERQDLLRRPVELAEVGDQEEGMQQQVIGALFQRLQRVVVGESGVDAHSNLGAVALVEPLHQVRNPGVGILGGTGVALAQQAADHVACFGQRGDQR